MSDFPIGARVTYEGEPADNPLMIGVVVEPTDKEIRYARASYDGGVGPDFGDVLVEWNPPDDRAWHQPDDLQVLP